MLNINTSGETANARPAATVILLRDGDAGPEVLMLRRNRALAFAGGLWVFPGGSIDQTDIDAAAGDVEAASRGAALREAKEESGLEVDAPSMELLSYWTTPVVEKKRFHTAFYVARVLGSQAVTVDGSEIHDSAWIGVEAAVRRHQQGELGLLPPTLMTLSQLAGHGGAEATLAAVRRAAVTEVAPVVGMRDGVPAVIFAGDAGFEDADPAAPGARNRCEQAENSWHYVYESGGPRLDRLQ